MTDNITGKVIIITGASSGMGAATAHGVAAVGANPPPVPPVKSAGCWLSGGVL